MTMTENEKAFISAILVEALKAEHRLKALRDVLRVYGVPSLPEAGADKAVKAAGALKAARQPAPARAEKEAKRDAAARTSRPLVTTPEPQETADLEQEEASAVTTPRRADDGDRLVPRYDAKLARDDRIRELWPTDMTLAMIGEEVGISTSSVSLAAKRMGLPSRLYRCGQRPTDIAETEADAEAAPPAPEPTVPPSAPKHETNGHVFTMHGVSLTHEEVTFNGKDLWINESQYRALHALLRAAPHPIGIPHLVGKVYPGKRKEEAETVFGILVKDLSKNLPSIGLGINDMKGVGIALTGSDA